MNEYSTPQRKRKRHRTHPAQLDLFRDALTPAIYEPAVHVLSHRARLPLHMAAVFASLNRLGGQHG